MILKLKKLPVKAAYQTYELIFKQPAGTSRGVLKTKQTYFLTLENGKRKGIGECAVFRGLSSDDTSDYEEKLAWLCKNIHLREPILWERLKKYPSIQFGMEQAFLSLKSDHPYLLFESDFTRGKKTIPINGLVWMGDLDCMKKQVHQKIKQGYKTLKLKIGALDFEKECALLSEIRKKFSQKDIQIRLDANGGFSREDCFEKLEILSRFEIHSIEQPVKPQQFETMQMLCKKSPIPIALDEELIGVLEMDKKYELLKKLRPQYIILKPSLLGGIKHCLQWMAFARKLGIDYWITSALESNIGLNALAQWTAFLNLKGVQGLGTGHLFTNNVPLGLVAAAGKLRYLESATGFKKNLKNIWNKR